MEKKSLGSFIAALRKAKGLTQQELADRLYISNKAVSKWECGETSPDISLLPIIAEVLGVSCDELLRGERILTEKQNEKTEKRGEKQLKFLVNKSLFKYKNISLISVILIFIGLVIMYSVSYSAYRPDIGFAITVSLFFVALAVQIFALGWLNHKIADNELLDEQASDDLLKTISDTRYKYSFWIFYSVFFVFFLILPLFVIRDNVIITSVLPFGEYLELIPIYVLLPITVAFAAKELYKRFIYKNIANKSGLLAFDLMQNSLILIILVLFFTFSLSYTISGGFGWYLYAILGIVISFLIVALVKKDKKIIAKISAITLRNLAYLISMMLFFSGSYTINDELYLNYNTSTSFISAVIIVATTLIYALLTKNKNIYAAE